MINMYFYYNHNTYKKIAYFFYRDVFLQSN